MGVGLREILAEIWFIKLGARPPCGWFLREDRSMEYLDALATLIADVSGERVTRSDGNVIISADAI
jgi:hypothetical protein